MIFCEETPNQPKKLNFVYCTIEIQSGAIDGLDKATTVQMKRNALKELNSGMFCGLKSLESLHLDRNQISVIADGTFKEFSKLKVLHLNYNKLTELRGEMFCGLS